MQTENFSLVMGISQPTSALWSLMLSAQRKALLACCLLSVCGKLEPCDLLLRVLNVWTETLPFLHNWSGPLINALVFLEPESINKLPSILEILEYA